MTSEATSAMVGPYRIDGLIGRGGMGEVFRAWDTRRQRTVALKLLPAALSGDDEYRERFRRESLTASGLTSPHIVPIHDFGDIDGRLFIDMRLIDGADLASHVSGRPMVPHRAVAILVQVCDALANAHSVGVVHRDVKPSNILLTGSDFAYLVDFGIATTEGAGTALTATGNTIGTFGYMAPERFDGRPADPRADIYSLGCVLHELLTGARPFADQISTPSLIRAHLMVEPTPPSLAGVPVPPALDDAVLRTLAKDPAQRPQHVIEFADALRDSLGGPGRRPTATRGLTSFAAPPWSPPTGVGTPASGSPVPGESSRGRGRRKAIIAGGLAVALLGTGVAAGSMISGSADDSTGTTTSAPAFSPLGSGLLAGGPQQPTAALDFGDSHELRPGITATAAEPVPYQPSASAAGEEGAARVMRVEITMQNDTERFVNFGEQYMVNLQIDGARTTSVLDTFNDTLGHVVGGVEGRVVPPGGQAVFSVAWALPSSTTPISVQLSPSGIGAGSQAATWAGEA